MWTGEFEDVLAQKKGQGVYPGMMFGLAKERMERTRLWKIIRKMPKGALLHAHMDALVDLDFIFQTMLGTPGMHAYCEHGIASPAELEGASIRFRYLKSEKGKYVLVLKEQRAMADAQD